MIIPSIDIMDGRAVQLVGGREKVIDAGDPRPLAETFALAGDVAVVDLDAALGRGSNTDLIRDLLHRAPCRVGGGIRDPQTALDWLDAGAVAVVLGTAARPEVLCQLPRQRVIAALDAEHGEVVVEGWRRPTGAKVRERIAELDELVAGFLVTFVEREGRLQGTAMDEAAELARLTGKGRVTIAGGITTVEDIAALDRMGADAQVGMALYSGRLTLGDALAAPLTSDRPDGLWPTVVCDERGTALGLAYSSRESLDEALRTRRGVYQSRRRGLWKKGETSGDIQQLLRVSADCDRDTLRFTVRQHGRGFCHLEQATCFGDLIGLARLDERLRARLRGGPAGSYTRRLLDDDSLLRAKLIEEAGELAEAKGSSDIAHEAADLIYFAMVALVRGGVSLAEVEEELERRSLRVRRRAGDAKPGGGEVSP
jgi:phosphoribosyl-ATP pyrophosphohydrolase